MTNGYKLYGLAVEDITSLYAVLELWGEGVRRGTELLFFQNI